LRLVLPRYPTVTPRNGASTFYSRNLGPCPKKQNLWLALAPSGFIPTNTDGHRTPSVAKPFWILCSGPRPSADSAGTSNQATSTTVGVGTSNRWASAVASSYRVDRGSHIHSRSEFC